jgi:hypothetical protein
MEANPEQTIEQVIQELTLPIDESTSRFTQACSRDTTFR